MGGFIYGAVRAHIYTLEPRSMRRLGLAVLSSLLLLLLGCGGSSKPTTTVTISPLTATVGAFGTVQFTATVTNNTNTSVTWQVAGITGGNSTNGTITSSGLYTAPTIATSSTSVTVTAISVADTTVSAAATVNVTGTGTFVAISPPSATLFVGAQQTFAATNSVSGKPIAVAWRVNCQSNSPGACGAITDTGVYTAPVAPPPGGTVSITATTLDGSAAPGTVSATIELPNSLLSGQYAYSFGGSAGIAGSITFDGAGNITGGSEDRVAGSASTRSITGGTYTVAPDGRTSATVNTSAGTETWEITPAGSGHAFVSASDSGGATFGGTLDQQTGPFSAGQVLGSFAFSVSSSTGYNLAGVFRADGVSHITGGLADQNAAGSTNLNVTLTGSFTPPDNNGRGTLTLTNSANSTQIASFAYYIVSITRLKLVELDQVSNPSNGDAVTQTGVPFSNGSFNATYAFVVKGLGASGSVGRGGTITLDGTGNVPSGLIDTNNNGAVQTGTAATGTYSVTDPFTGRSTLNLSVGGNNLQYVFYPQANGVLNLIEIDTTSASGPALATAGSLNSNSALNGKYATSWTGVDLAPPGPNNISGVLSADGAGTLSGTLDIANAGALNTSVGVTNGQYSVSNGQASASFQTAAAGFTSAALRIYPVNTGQALLLEVDSNSSPNGARIMTGTLVKTP